MFIFVIQLICVGLNYGLLLGSLFNGISTLEGNLMPKTSLQKNSSDTILLKAGGEVHTFPWGISPKVSAVA